MRRRGVLRTRVAGGAGRAAPCRRWRRRRSAQYPPPQPQPLSATAARRRSPTRRPAAVPRAAAAPSAAVPAPATRRRIRRTTRSSIPSNLRSPTRQQPYGQPLSAAAAALSRALQPAAPATAQPYPPPPTSAAEAAATASPGEMAYLYGVSAAYGVGTGVWLDSLVARDRSGHLASSPPIALGAAAPIGAYVWDDYDEFTRGVPSSIATGLLLGGVEGIAIGGLQWQLTGQRRAEHVGLLDADVGDVRRRPRPAASAATSSASRLGPDPRTLAFISSGAGLGTAFGVLFGVGRRERRTGRTAPRVVGLRRIQRRHRRDRHPRRRSTRPRGDR